MRSALRSLATLLLLACAAASAQPRAGAGLLDAFRAALDFDPAYRAARQEHLAAIEGIELAIGARRPEVALVGSANRNALEQQIGPTGRTPNYTGASLALQLRQPIVNRELQSREQQARLRARQAEAQLEARRLELSERVVDAYVQYARTIGVLELTREDLQRQQQLIEAARRSLQGGEGTVTEVLEATSRADVLRSELGAAETARLDAIEALQALTGPGLLPAPRRVALRLPESPAPSELADIESLAALHPEVRARQVGVELARENIEAARAPYRPRLDWSASAGRTENDAVNTLNQVNTLASVGVQFNVPLYDGGRDRSATRQAVLLVERAQADLDEALETVRLRLRQGLRGLGTSAQRWSAIQSAKRTTEQLITATRRSIAGGVRSRADLLLAERQLAQVLREEQAVLADHLRAWWRLAAARGQADEAQLGRLETFLETP